MFEFATYWDILEFKFLILFVTLGLAVALTQWLYKKNKGKK